MYAETVATVDRSTSRAAVGAPLGRVLSLTMALTLWGSAMIHSSIVAGHFNEWWAFGTFFAVTTVAQLVAAILVTYEASRRLVVAIVVGSAGLIALWAVTRVIGLPVGPEQFTPEALGWQDLTSVGLELVTIGAALAFLRGNAGDAEAPLR